MSTSYSSTENQPVSLIRRRWTEYSQRVTASLEIKKQRGHLLVLDGVRAVAALAVVLHHVIYQIVLPKHWAGLWKPSGKHQVILAALLSFGASGVILFFLLSSFLLFLPFARMLLFDEQRPSVARFYIRRFFRVLPGYYVAIILMVLFFHPEFLYDINRLKLLEFFTFSMQAHVPEQLNGPFWTMAVEFQFYMLLPLIAWLLGCIVRRGTLRWRIFKLVSCLLFILGWGLFSRWLGLFITPSSTSFPQNILASLQPFYYGDNGKYFESFAVGMLLAVLYVYTQYAPQGEVLRRKLQHWNIWMFLVGLLILSFFALYSFCITDNAYGSAFAFIGRHRTVLTQLYAQWQSIGYSLSYGLCVCALLYNYGWLKRSFEWVVLRWIGLFSFSLYMWHLPFLLLFLNIMSQQPQGKVHTVQYAALLAWVFFVIFPISLTLYRWIEMPGMRLGEMLIQKIEKLKKRATPRKTSPLDANEKIPLATRSS